MLNFMKTFEETLQTEFYRQKPKNSEVASLSASPWRWMPRNRKRNDSPNSQRASFEHFSIYSRTCRHPFELPTLCGLESEPAIIGFTGDNAINILFVLFSSSYVMNRDPENLVATLRMRYALTISCALDNQPFYQRGKL